MSNKFELRRHAETRKIVHKADVLNYFKNSRVAPDGNCGYRSFAVSFLANGGEKHLEKLSSSNLLPDAKDTLQSLKKCATNIDCNCSDLRTRLQRLGDDVKKPKKSAMKSKYWFDSSSSADAAARLTCSSLLVAHPNNKQNHVPALYDPSRFKEGKEHCKAVVERGLHNRVYGSIKFNGADHFDALVYKEDKYPLYIGQKFVPREIDEIIDLVSDESDDNADDNKDKEQPGVPGARNVVKRTSKRTTKGLIDRYAPNTETELVIQKVLKRRRDSAFRLSAAE